MTVVLDATQDDRFAESDLVIGWPHIRFYAGAPLKVERNGKTFKVGTLCVIETAVEHGGTGAREHFSVKEKQMLIDFASMVVDAMELRRQSLQEKQLAKHQYITCTAHDMRTPLTSFRLGLELLRQTELSQEQKEVLEQSELACDIMVDTITRAIEVGRSLYGAPLPCARDDEPVDVRKLSTKCLALVEGLPREVPVVVAVARNVPGCVLSDSTLLWRCLSNYVTNAINNTEDGAVHVRWSATRGAAVGDARGTNSSDDEVMQGDDATRLLRLEVADTGPGVPPEMREAIWEPFVQVQGRKSARSGTGLGLKAVKQCVDMLGGRCGVTDNDGALARSDEKAVAADSCDAADDAGARARRASLGASVQGSIFWVEAPLRPCAGAAAAEAPLAPFRITSLALRRNMSSDHNLCNPCGEGDGPALHRIASGAGLFAPDSAASPAAAVTPEFVDRRELEDGAPAAANGAPAAVGGEKEPRRAERPLRVLVIDDSSTVRKLLTRLLQRAGFEVDEAENGLEALKLLCGANAFQHDVALVDFLMPVLDGISCITRYREWESEQLRSRAAGTDAAAARGPLYVVGISANADTQDVARARDGGMDEFLTKPIDMEKLSQLLHGRFGVAIPTTGSPRPEAPEQHRETKRSKVSST